MKGSLAQIRVVCALFLTIALAYAVDRRDSPPLVKDARAIKAAYIYNFTKFIDWGSEEGRDVSASPITICVIGTDTVGAQLHEISELRAKGRSIQVVQLSDTTIPSDCHILYIGASEHKRLAQILDIAKSKTILTVSDMADFTKTGGMIGFVSDKGRILVEINTELVQAAGLKISSKLLEVARRAPTPRP